VFLLFDVCFVSMFMDVFFEFLVFGGLGCFIGRIFCCLCVGFARFKVLKTSEDDHPFTRQGG